MEPAAGVEDPVAGVELAAGVEDPVDGVVSSAACTMNIETITMVRTKTNRSRLTLLIIRKEVI